MIKQNKSKKELWPFLVVGIGVIFAIGAIVQHLSFDKSAIESNVNNTEDNSMDYFVEEKNDAVSEENSNIVEVIDNSTLVEKESVESFNEAFSKARKDLGIGKTFVWDGKEYSTFFVGEAQKQLQELITIPNEDELEPEIEIPEEELVIKDGLIVSNVVENQDVTHVSE